MYTKEQLKKQLENMGLTGDETILIHSSMKSIGEVEGGADTVLDAWIEYFGHGLLLLPTHTWKNINADSPVYNPKETPSCVGLLTNMFLKRDGVIRSLHPTHSGRISCKGGEQQYTVYTRRMLRQIKKLWRKSSACWSRT